MPQARELATKIRGYKNKSQHVPHIFVDMKKCVVHLGGLRYVAAGMLALQVLAQGVQ